MISVRHLQITEPADQQTLNSFLLFINFHNCQATFTGVDRLFIIPPSLPFSGDVVSEAATAAKEAGVKHVLLLSASSAEMNPDHKYAPMKGSYYYNQKKVP